MTEVRGFLHQAVSNQGRFGALATAIEPRAFGHIRLTQHHRETTATYNKPIPRNHAHQISTSI